VLATFEGTWKERKTITKRADETIKKREKEMHQGHREQNPASKTMGGENLVPGGRIQSQLGEKWS